MRKDQQGKEDQTLRSLSSLLCKRVDIGTAILPKPLFIKEGQNGEKIANATIDCVDVLNKDHDKEEETEYANIVQSEFNAVVIEVSSILVLVCLFCRTFYLKDQNLNSSLQ